MVFYYLIGLEFECYYIAPLNEGKIQEEEKSKKFS